MKKKIILLDQRPCQHQELHPSTWAETPSESEIIPGTRTPCKLPLKNSTYINLLYSLNDVLSHYLQFPLHSLPIHPIHKLGNIHPLAKRPCSPLEVQSPTKTEIPYKIICHKSCQNSDHITRRQRENRNQRTKQPSKKGKLTKHRCLEISIIEQSMRIEMPPAGQQSYSSKPLTFQRD